MIRHLDAVARDASPDFVDLTVLYLTALLKLQILPDVGRPRKLPFGKYGDYWAVEKVAEEEYPTGQIRSIMTSLVLSPDIWSVDALSLYTCLNVYFATDSEGSPNRPSSRGWLSF